MGTAAGGFCVIGDAVSYYTKQRAPRRDVSLGGALFRVCFYMLLIDGADFPAVSDFIHIHAFGAADF